MSEDLHELEVPLDDDQAVDDPVDEQERPELEEPAAPAATPQFSYNDRLYALGYSTSGKSEVLNVIFSGLRCQRLLIDNKPEFAIPELEPVHHPDSIDWTAPLIHYQPAPGSDASQYEEIFAEAFTRRGLVVCVHELGALVDYNANRAGRYLISYMSQGARLGLGLLAGTQRPVWVPTAGTSEAKHVLVFTPQLARRDDNAAAADAISPVDGQPVATDDLLSELTQLHADHGPWSFLWKHRDTGTLTAFPPLPESIRAQSIVKRLEDG
jgi:hypothetical protein